MTLTAQEAAALDFKPWTGSLKDDHPDLAQKTQEMWETHRVTILLATGLHYKPKEELIEFIRDDGEAANELCIAFGPHRNRCKPRLTCFERVRSKLL